MSKDFTSAKFTKGDFIRKSQPKEKTTIPQNYYLDDFNSYALSNRNINEFDKNEASIIGDKPAELDREYTPIKKLKELMDSPKVVKKKQEKGNFLESQDYSEIKKVLFPNQNSEASNSFHFPLNEQKEGMQVPLSKVSLSTILRLNRTQNNPKDKF